MRKLFNYLIIRITCRNAETAIAVYEKIYNPVVNQTINITKNSETLKSHDVEQSQPLVSNKSTIVTVNKNVDKKQEILDSLDYLKSKKIKTKQDRESIYSLEMVLKNMK